MFITNRQDIKLILKEYKETKIPKLNYEGSQEVKVSAEYFKDMIKLIQKCKIKTLKLIVKNDMPLTIETEYFKFILAPRID